MYVSFRIPIELNKLVKGHGGRVFKRGHRNQWYKVQKDQKGLKKEQR